jgi:hypothetical protein
VILKRILREPLLHFLVVGGLLFGIFTWSHRGSAKQASGKTIVVDKASLLNFLQYRNKAFKPEYFESQLDAMSPRELQDLSDQYVEEELLYREAKSLGLEEGDDVIRQRLVQKMNFLIEDLADTSGTPSEAELEEYLKKNQSQYIIEPSVTFTHVFADSSVHGEKAAKELAERLKAQLNSTHAAFNDAPQFGDRFPFLQNYVERTFDYIASHCGDSEAHAFSNPVGRAVPIGVWISPCADNVSIGRPYSATPGNPSSGGRRLAARQEGQGEDSLLT